MSKWAVASNSLRLRWSGSDRPTVCLSQWSFWLRVNPLGDDLPMARGSSLETVRAPCERLWVGFILGWTVVESGTVCFSLPDGSVRASSTVAFWLSIV